MSATKQEAGSGDKVRVGYVGTFDDGTVFDQSGDEPLEFTLASGDVIKGFDDAVLGMAVGDEKDIVIEPKDAYGDVNPALKSAVQKSQLPPHDYQAGMQLVMQTPEGQRIPVRIAAVQEDTVTLDLNHPLAGKRLHFHLTLVGIA